MVPSRRRGLLSTAPRPWDLTNELASHARALSTPRHCVWCPRALLQALFFSPRANNSLQENQACKAGHSLLPQGSLQTPSRPRAWRARPCCSTSSCCCLGHELDPGIPTDLKCFKASVSSSHQPDLLQQDELKMSHDGRAAVAHELSEGWDECCASSSHPRQLHGLQR